MLTLTLAEGRSVWIKSIQASLLREFGRNYKRPALYYALKVRVGYVYKNPKDLRVAMSPKRQSQLRKHLEQRQSAVWIDRSGRSQRKPSTETVPTAAKPAPNVDIVVGDV